MSTGAEDTSLSVYAPAQDMAKPVQDTASLLWQYKNNNTIMGVPVIQQSRNLTFAKQQDLLQAMQPINQIQVFTGYLSPQHKQDVQQYKNIKQLVAQGAAAILSQDKQFIPDKNAFMYIVVYSKYSYKLNQRYNFYKQDFEDGKREPTV